MKPEPECTCVNADHIGCSFDAIFLPETGHRWNCAHKQHAEIVMELLNERKHLRAALAAKEQPAERPLGVMPTPENSPPGTWVKRIKDPQNYLPEGTVCRIVSWTRNSEEIIVDGHGCFFMAKFFVTSSPPTPPSRYKAQTVYVHGEWRKDTGEMFDTHTATDKRHLFSLTPDSTVYGPMVELVLPSPPEPEPLPQRTVSEIERDIVDLVMKCGTAGHPVQGLGSEVWRLRDELKSAKVKP